MCTWILWAPQNRTWQNLVGSAQVLLLTGIVPIPMTRVLPVPKWGLFYRMEQNAGDFGLSWESTEQPLEGDGSRDAAWDGCPEPKGSRQGWDGQICTFSPMTLFYLLTLLIQSGRKLERQFWRLVARNLDSLCDAVPNGLHAWHLPDSLVVCAPVSHLTFVLDFLWDSQQQLCHSLYALPWITEWKPGNYISRLNITSERQSWRFGR